MDIHLFLIFSIAVGLLCPEIILSNLISIFTKIIISKFILTVSKLLWKKLLDLFWKLFVEIWVYLLTIFLGYLASYLFRPNNDYMEETELADPPFSFLLQPSDLPYHPNCFPSYPIDPPNHLPPYHSHPLDPPSHLPPYHSHPFDVPSNLPLYRSSSTPSTLRSSSPFCQPPSQSSSQTSYKPPSRRSTPSTQPCPQSSPPSTPLTLSSPPPPPFEISEDSRSEDQCDSNIDKKAEMYIKKEHARLSYEKEVGLPWASD